MKALPSKAYRQIRPKPQQELEDGSSGDGHGCTSDILSQHITPLRFAGTPPEAKALANPIDGFFSSLEGNDPVGLLQSFHTPLQGGGLTFSRSTVFDPVPVTAFEPRVHASTGLEDPDYFDLGKFQAQSGAEGFPPDLVYADHSDQRDPTFNEQNRLSSENTGLNSDPMDAADGYVWYPLLSATTQVDNGYEVPREPQYENSTTCTQVDGLRDGRYDDARQIDVTVPALDFDAPWSTEKVLHGYHTNFLPCVSLDLPFGRIPAASHLNDVYQHTNPHTPRRVCSHTSRTVDTPNAMNTPGGSNLSVTPPTTLSAISKVSSSSLVLPDAELVKLTKEWTHCIFPDCKATFDGERTCDRKHNYKRHVESYHPTGTTNKYKCRGCPKTDARKDNLKRHERAKHPNLFSTTQPPPRRPRKK